MPGKLEGKIVSITAAGNLVTDLTADRLRGVPRDPSVRIRCDEHETVGIYSRDHQEPESTLLALVGDSGCLELEIVGLSAAIMLGLPVGEKVVVEW